MTPSKSVVCTAVESTYQNTKTAVKHEIRSRDGYTQNYSLILVVANGNLQWLLPGQSTEIQASGNEALILRKLPLPGEDAGRELTRSILIL